VLRDLRPPQQGEAHWELAGIRYNDPMAKTSTIHSFNAAKFRLGRVAKDWGELEAILRQAAAEPGYGGPAIDVVEQVGANIARIRIAVRDWPLNMALRDFSARRQHGGDGEDLRADPRGPAALKLPIFPTST
jgi:hypothetical protein